MLLSEDSVLGVWGFGELMHLTVHGGLGTTLFRVRIGVFLSRLFRAPQHDTAEPKPYTQSPKP